MTIEKSALRDFIYAEARLLDEGRYDAWINLLTEDVVYWMPLNPDEGDPRLETTLFHDDLLLLKVRVARLAGDRTYSQQPRSRCHHLLQQPHIESFDSGGARFLTTTAFHYTESRGDERHIYVGWADHELVRAGDQLRIRRKKIRLIDCDAPHRNIQLLM